MSAPDVISYGVVVVLRSSDAASPQRVLLVCHKSSHHWSFPKGRPEAGEDALETALREVDEETGVSRTAYEIVEDGANNPVRHVCAYTYQRRDGKTVRKEVHLFLGLAKNEVPVRPQLREVTEVQWVPVEELDERVTFGADLEAIQSLLAALNGTLPN